MDSNTHVDKADTANILWDMPSRREEEQPSLSALVMMDNSHFEFAFVAGEMTEAEMAMLKPEQYKDVFEDPPTFDAAWNHPSPFQRALWRAAINKEFAKMKEREVWKMHKRSQMPHNRRLVKCKWVCLWKRDGTARARLVAKGFSEVPYVDYDPLGIMHQ